MLSFTVHLIQSDGLVLIYVLYYNTQNSCHIIKKCSPENQRLCWIKKWSYSLTNDMVNIVQVTHHVLEKKQAPPKHCIQVIHKIQYWPFLKSVHLKMLRWCRTKKWSEDIFDYMFL